jgi:hypothetical protein
MWFTEFATVGGASRIGRVITTPPPPPSCPAVGPGQVSATITSPTTATLTGIAYAACTGPASAHFDYGTDEHYGASTPDVPVSGTQTITAPLAGLKPGTEYHYRMVFETRYSSTWSPADHTFATPPAEPIVNLHTASIVRLQRSSIVPVNLVCVTAGSGTCAVSVSIKTQAPAGMTTVGTTQLRVRSNTPIIARVHLTREGRHLLYRRRRIRVIAKAITRGELQPAKAAFTITR